MGQPFPSFSSLLSHTPPPIAGSFEADSSFQEWASLLLSAVALSKDSCVLKEITYLF